VVYVRLRRRSRLFLALGIRLELETGGVTVIHWDWVSTLVVAVFVVKTAELFLRVVVDALFDTVYPYMKSFTKATVVAQFPQASGLVDELLPDDQEWNNYDPTTKHEGTVVPPTTPQT
jgi:hypothetical protein